MTITNRASPACLALALFAGCASAPPPVAPGLPPTPDLPGAPAVGKPPRAPQRISASNLRYPRIVKTRMQEIGEVYKETFSFTGAPATFRLDPSAMMVLAIPRDISLLQTQAAAPGSNNSVRDELRCALANGFLASGFRVRDAGQYEDVKFNINLYPGDSSRTVKTETKDGDKSKTITLTTTEKRPWYWSSWWSWYNKRGIQLRLSDPVSLWTPELMSYKGLKSQYLLRIFRLHFDERYELPVKLSTVFTREALTAFRRKVEAVNARIEDYNARIDALQQELQAYQTRYASYKQRYDVAYRDYQTRYRSAVSRFTADYESDYQEYVDRFNTWRRRNPTGKVAMARKRNVSAMAPVLEPRGSLPMEAAIPMPRRLTVVDADEIIRRTTASRVVRVPIVKFYVLAEVVDTKGEVVWVGKLSGNVQRGPDAKERVVKKLAELMTQGEKK